MSTVTAPATATVPATKALPGKPLNNDMRAKYARLTALRAEIAEREAEKKALTADLLADMGEHTVALFGGIKVFSVVTATRIDLDRNLFREAFPEAYEAAAKSSTYQQIR